MPDLTLTLSEPAYAALRLLAEQRSTPGLQLTIEEVGASLLTDKVQAETLRMEREQQRQEACPKSKSGRHERCPMAPCNLAGPGPHCRYCSIPMEAGQ